MRDMRDVGVCDLVELLELRAAGAQGAEKTGVTGFTFLADGERQEQHLSFAELYQRARAIAALLQSKVPAGERVILLYPPGLDYIAAFFGCLYGGFVAVPAYPPNPARLQRTVPRLQAIVNDAGAEVVLTTRAIAAMTAALSALAPDLAGKTWLATDAIAPGLEAAWRRPAIAPETLALLQYTSGSTGAPKGVMLTHANLIANQEMIRAVFGVSPRSVGVGWLPLYHDMGLIGNVLQPIYSNFRFVLMSPLHFLARPMRWLEAITRYRATASGGPNFAYDLCVRRIGPGERDHLDLRSWEVAFTGAEPVRAQTLELFAAAFAGSGFARRAFRPCFGLAEASLLVSGTPAAGGVQVRALDARALEHGRAVAPSPSGATRALVGAGPAAPGSRVVIVDPVTRRRRADGQVGEVWVAGPHVAIGYWADAEATEAAFGARLSDDPDARFLRTGDLGFVDGGELYLCGRLKDLIILRGRNYYPQDFERCTEHAHPGLRRGCAAAFSIDAEGEERLVIAIEVEPGAQAAAGEIFAAIRRDIAASFEAHVHAIALVAAGAIPKTSSGKIQRRACRDQFLQGSLDVVRATRDREGVEADADAGVDAGDGTWDLRSAPPDRRPALVDEIVRGELARVLRVGRDQVDMAAPLAGLGLDSLMAVELGHRTAERLGVALPVAAWLGDESATELVARVAAMLAATPRALTAATPEATTAATPRALTTATPEATPAATLEALTAATPEALAAPGPAAGDVFPVSAGQESMWFLQQLAPDSAAYNLATALRLTGEFSPAVLERALRHLIARHPALHTTYAEVDGRPVQEVRPELAGAFALEIVDAAAWSGAELDARLCEVAARPFDLAAGPVLRASLFTRSPGDATLVLAAHHIATDLWSIVVLLSELRAAYPALRAGRDVAAPIATGPGYRAFVDWQRDYLATHGDADAAYWQAQIADAPALELPCDRPRPEVPSARGAVVRTRIEPALAAAITELARREAVTPYVVLLAAFEILLARWSGQPLFVVGTPVAGRPAASFARVVGYFVNALPLRADLGGDPSLGALLQRVRSTVLGALEHPHYPFLRTVQRSARPRDPGRSPVFQVMFVLEQPVLAQEAETMMLVLGAGDAPASFGGFALASHPLPHAAAQYDLTLSVAQAGGEMAASFAYSADRFERETIERAAAQYAALLRQLVARPSGAVADLVTDEIAGPPARRAKLCAYWRDQLAGAPPVLELPTDRPRTAAAALERATERFVVPATLADELRALGSARGATLDATLLAALAVLLARHAGQDEVVIGAPVGMPGHRGTLVPLRVRLGDDPTFAALIDRVRATAAAACAHADLPLAELIDLIGAPLERSPAHHPVFQAVFQAMFQGVLPGVAPAPELDLVLSITERGDALHGRWDYRRDRFDPQTLARATEHLQTLLRAMVEAPEQRARQAPLLAAAERHQILHAWNDTAVVYPDARGLHQLFAAQAARTPGAVAVRCGGAVMTYAALSARVNQIARHLIGLGIRRGARVAVSLPRSPELLASLLGVLATGAAYVPLDPRYPRARRAFLLADAAPAALITDRADAELPPGVIVVRPADITAAANGHAVPAARVAPGDPAYLMYTSGSSGQPKAAIISHAALGNYLRWCAEAYGVARGAGAVVSTSVAFDATVTSLFSPLLVGSAVVMVPEHGSGGGDGHGEDIAALAAIIASGEPLGPLKLTPAHIDALRAASPAPRPGRVHAIVVGGEPLFGEHVAWCRAAAPEARIFNEYGPTETTVGCSIYEVPAEPPPAVVPIGRPIANTRLYVLDAYGTPSPIGVTGELYIGGAGVAQGYHARPELTAERFVDDPFSPEPGARMYRTGDLAAYLPDGNLRFLGRRDGQVKLRGYRIELAEIEAALARHPSVGHAAASVQRAASGDPRLVAFVVAAAGAPAPAPEALRRHLADELPDPMVPSIIAVVPELPLTPNGKIDRRALPVVTAAPRPYTAPTTPVQEAMCEIAAELLGVPRIGIHDNFFELGGHSLLATQFVSRVRKRLRVDLTVRLVFTNPTIALQETALFGAGVEQGEI